MGVSSCFVQEYLMGEGILVEDVGSDRNSDIEQVPAGIGRYRAVMNLLEKGLLKVL